MIPNEIHFFPSKERKKKLLRLEGWKRKIINLVYIVSRFGESENHVK